MNIKEILFSLSNACCIGEIKDATVVAKDVLSAFCNVTDLNGASFVGEFNSNKAKTVLIEAHIDEVGMIVTNVDDNGFVTVAACGGIDVKTLPSSTVVIHSKEKVTGVFCTTPPHLSKSDETYESISDLKIDTGLNKKAKEIISVGDFVTYDVKATSLCESRISGKSLDNRAGCAALLLLAEKLSGKELPVNVVLMFSDSEELGMRGARTAAYGITADEAVAVDVSFALAPDLPTNKCGHLSKGTMIGISPILSSAVYKKLLALAKEKDIAYQTEVMGGTTGTDADVISVTKEGIPCGLLSVPLRNMHSSVEVVDINDIKATADLLEAYILDGGAI